MHRTVLAHQPALPSSTSHTVDPGQPKSRSTSRATSVSELPAPFSTVKSSAPRWLSRSSRFELDPSLEMWQFAVAHLAFKLQTTENNVGCYNDTSRKSLEAGLVPDEIKLLLVLSWDEDPPGKFAGFGLEFGILRPKVNERGAAHLRAGGSVFCQPDAFSVLQQMSGLVDERKPEDVVPSVPERQLQQRLFRCKPPDRPVYP